MKLLRRAKKWCLLSEFLIFFLETLQKNNEKDNVKTETNCESFKVINSYKSLREKL